MSRALQDTHLLVSIYVTLYEFDHWVSTVQYIQSYGEDTSISLAATVVPLNT